MSDCGRAGEWMQGVDSLEAKGETVAGATLTFRSRGYGPDSHVA